MGPSSTHEVNILGNLCPGTSRFNNNNNNNLFIYSALFNMLGDQKRITTINNLKTIQILKVYKYI